MPSGNQRPPDEIEDFLGRRAEEVLDEEARATGLGDDFVNLSRNVLRRESGMRGDVLSMARRSSAGAIGPMQLMPGTAGDLGVDPNDFHSNIRGGVKYLADQYRTFGGDRAKAAAAYNAGPGRVKKAGGVPNIKETQDYVRAVAQPEDQGDPEIEAFLGRQAPAQQPRRQMSTAERMGIKPIEFPEGKVLRTSTGEFIEPSQQSKYTHPATAPRGVRGVVNQFIQSAIKGTAAIPEGFAETVGALPRNDEIDVFNLMIEEGKTPEEAQRELPARLAQYQAQRSRNVAIKQDFRPITQAGRRFAEQVAPVDPTDQGFWSAKVPQALGSTVPFVAGTALAGGNPLAAAVLGASMNAQQVAEEFDAAGVPPEKRDRAVLFAGATGLTEAFGLGRALSKFGLTRPFIKRIADIAEEGGQEALQEYLNNVNAAVVGAYDPTRPLSRNVLESAVLGGIVGGAFQGTSAAASQIRGRVRPPVPAMFAAPTTPTAAPGAAPEAVLATPAPRPRPEEDKGLEVVRYLDQIAQIESAQISNEEKEAAMEAAREVYRARRRGNLSPETQARLAEPSAFTQLSRAGLNTVRTSPTPNIGAIVAPPSPQELVPETFGYVSGRKALPPATGEEIIPAQPPQSRAVREVIGQPDPRFTPSAQTAQTLPLPQPPAVRQEQAPVAPPTPTPPKLTRVEQAAQQRRVNVEAAQRIADRNREEADTAMSAGDLLGAQKSYRVELEALQGAIKNAASSTGRRTQLRSRIINVERTLAGINSTIREEEKQARKRSVNPNAPTAELPEAAASLPEAVKTSELPPVAQPEAPQTERLRVPKATLENIEGLRERYNELRREQYNRGGRLTGDLADEYQELGSRIAGFENEQAKAARGKRFDENAPPEGSRVEERPFQPATSKDRRRALDAVETRLKDEVSRATGTLPREDTEALERGVAAIDTLFAAVEQDADVADLFNRAAEGDIDAEAELRNYADMQHGIDGDTFDSIIDARRNARERRRVGKGTRTRATESRTETGNAGYGENRPAVKTPPQAQTLSAQDYQLLTRNPDKVADEDFDQYRADIEDLNNRQIRGLVEMPDWAARQLEARRKQAGEIRRGRVKEKRMPARFTPPPAKAKLLSKEEGGRRLVEQAKEKKAKETPTVVHPNPEIDKKPILAKTQDGRVIVPNEENKGGVSVVKDRSDEPTDYKFSSTQVNLPRDVADQIIAFGKRIPDTDLADDGREDTPHVTIKFGLHGSDPKFVREALAGEGPVTVKFGKVSLFTTNDDFDVVKVDIESADLHRLNKIVAESQPVTDTHPTYQPHATIAYVKKGKGTKYVGDTFLEGETVTLDSVLFSGRDGEKVEIPLGGKEAPVKAEYVEVKPIVAQSEAPKSDNWLKSLPDDVRERVFVVMRDIDKRVQSADEQERKLRPPYGTIGVGGADFDPMLKAESLGSFLRGLNKGMTPDAALAQAKQDAREMIKIWNERGVRGRAGVVGKFEMRRWEGAADANLADAWRSVLNASNAPETSREDRPMASVQRGSTIKGRSTQWNTPPVPRTPSGFLIPLTPEQRADQFEHSRAEFRQHATRARVYTNEQGAFTYAAVSNKVNGGRTGDEIPIAVDGLAVPLNGARKVIRYLLDRMAEKQSPTRKEVYNNLAYALEQAVRAAERKGDKAITIVSAEVRQRDQSGILRRSFEAVRQVATHEETHVWQMNIGGLIRRGLFSDEAITSDPDYEQQRQALIRFGYPENMSADDVSAEAVAHAVAGQWRDLGYKSEADAMKYLARVFDRVYTELGAEAMESLRLRTPKSKEAREDVRARRTNGGVGRGPRPGEAARTDDAGGEIRTTQASLSEGEGAGRRSGEGARGEVQGTKPGGRERTLASVQRGGPTEAPDQSGVKKGYVRVTDAAGKSYIVEGKRGAKPQQPAATERARAPRHAEPKAASVPSGEQIPLFPQKKKITGKEIASNIVSTLTLPRAFMASADLSAPLRQGAVLSLPPSQWGRAAKSGIRMLQAISTTQYNRLADELNSHPDAVVGKDHGLFMSTDPKRGASLQGREEDFISKLAANIPIVKQSEQAYKMYLDSIRLETFRKYKRSIDRDSRLSLEEKQKAYQSAAEWINIASGRGSLGKLDAAMPALSAIFFAPRYTASRIQLLNPMTYAKNSTTAAGRAVLKQQISDVVQFGSVVAATLLLAHAAGAGVGLDPEDPDFLKIKFGNKRYDILAGTQQLMRLFYRIGKDFGAVAVGKKSEGQGTFDILARFGRSKLAPVPSFFVDMITRKDFIGRDFEMGRAIKDRVMPLMWNDFLEAYQREGLGGAAKLTPGLLGVGVANYEKRAGYMNLGDKLEDEIHKHGLDYGYIKTLPGDTEKTHRERAARIERWLKNAGGQLISNPRYKTLPASQQREALERLRRAIGTQANLRVPNTSAFNPTAIIMGVRRSQQEKPLRDRKKIVVPH